MTNELTTESSNFYVPHWNHISRGEKEKRAGDNKASY